MKSVVRRRYWMLLSISLVSLSLLGGCDRADEVGEPAPQGSGAAIGEWGIETEYLSQNVKPGDDFFTFVNEGWLQSAEFPPGVPRIDSFIEAALNAEKKVGKIINQALTAPKNSNQQLIAALYKSYMDVKTLDALGVSPLQPKINAVLVTTTHDDIVLLMQQVGFTAVVDFGVEIDTRNPSRYILALGQGGLGLPSREYYIADDAPYPAHRSAYATYMKDLFTMAGLQAQVAHIPEIISLETSLAKVHWSNAQMRDPVRMTHYMTLGELHAYAPGINWLAMVNELGAELGSEDTVVTYTDSALKASAALFAKTPLEVMQAYLAFHLLDSYAELLSARWQDRHFEFHGRQLQGLAEQRSQKEQAIALLNDSLGEIVGQEYVREYFPPEYRDTLMTYIGYLKEAFKERIRGLRWMDESTRAEALVKLSNLKAEIGYPSRWHDYSSLDLKDKDLIGNINQIQQWKLQDSIAKLKEPVRDWEWGNNPQEINAYYSPPENKIVFLAAILQPPFYDPNADFAVNFGAILGVIGHETSHGFDDQGSQYDESGRLRNWWTDASRQVFNQRGDALAAQYDQYEPIAGAHINGRLTLGENIADLGGVSVAYHAMQKYINENYPEGAPVIDGFTAEQRFFLAWAQMWRSKRTEDFARELLLRDPHSPGRFRANGTVRNLDAWYKAFDVGPEHSLYLPPDQRITTW